MKLRAQLQSASAYLSSRIGIAFRGEKLSRRETAPDRAASRSPAQTTSTRRVLAACAMVLFWSGQIGYPQPSPATISGTITNVDSVPLSNVHVFVWDSDEIDALNNDIASSPITAFYSIFTLGLFLTTFDCCDSDGNPIVTDTLIPTLASTITDGAGQYQVTVDPNLAAAAVVAFVVGDNQHFSEFYDDHPADRESVDDLIDGNPVAIMPGVTIVDAVLTPTEDTSTIFGTVADTNSNLLSNISVFVYDSSAIDDLNNTLSTAPDSFYTLGDQGIGVFTPSCCDSEGDLIVSGGVLASLASTSTDANGFYQFDVVTASGPADVDILFVDTSNQHFPEFFDDRVLGDANVASDPLTLQRNAVVNVNALLTSYKARFRDTAVDSILTPLSNVPVHVFDATAIDRINDDLAVATSELSTFYSYDPSGTIFATTITGSVEDPEFGSIPTFRDLTAIPVVSTFTDDDGIYQVTIDTLSTPSVNVLFLPPLPDNGTFYRQHPAPTSPELIVADEVIVEPGLTTSTFSNDLLGALYLANPATPLHTPFQPDVVDYTATVNNDVLAVSVVAIPQHPSATVAGTGSHSLVVGDNLLTVVVDATGVGTREYTINVRRQSRNSNLGSLSISEFAFAPGFAATTTSYSATAPPDASDATITAIAEHPDAAVTGAGVIPVAFGDNQLTIRVTAEDFRFNTDYTLDIFRQNAPPSLTVLGDNPATVAVGAVYMDAGADAFDDVDGDLSMEILTGGLPISTSAPGTHIVTYEVTDSSAHTAQAERVVNVIDVTPPVIFVSDVSVEATGPLTAVTVSATATDDVDGTVTPVTEPAAPATFPVGSTSVTWKATDAAGNSATTVQTVTVVDTTAPSILVDDVTVEATGAETPIALSATATDLVDGAITPVQDPPALAAFPVGATSVTWRATDAAGNSVTAVQTVTVIDTGVPAIFVQNVTVEATGLETPVTLSASATDLVDGAITPVQDPPAPAAFPIGSTTVIWRATDMSGNTVTTEQTVTIVDTTAPVISVDDLTVEATGPETPVPLSATATDLVDGAVSPTSDAAAGFPLGTTVVTWSATDSEGNSASATQNVTLVDTTTPSLTVPAPVTLEAETPAGAPFAFTPVVSDQVDPVPAIGCTPASGSVFPLGQTVITCTATDASGNTSQASFEVVVVDTTAPALTVPADIAVGGTSAAGAEVDFMAIALDAVDPSPTILYSQAPGSTFPLGTTTVLVTATDATGNSSAGSFTVTVVNSPPIAEAFIEQLTNIGAIAQVRLDGSASSDAQDPLSSLTFEWFVDGTPVGTDVTVDAFLGFGLHEIVLQVTDTGGLVGEVTKQINTDPAALAVFDAEKAQVHFKDSHPRVTLSGEIGLPTGVSHPEVAALAQLSLMVAGVELVTTPEVVFERKGGDGKHWDFKDNDAVTGVRKLDIDWKGARFDFKDRDHDIELKSELITSSETVLKLKYKVDKAGGPFAIDFGGLAQVSIDADGAASAQGAGLVVDKQAREVTLTLPFPLLETMDMVFTGAVVQTVPVAAHYTLSIGRFKLEVHFDAALFPDEALTLPRTIETTVSIGEQGYPGESSLGPDDLEVKNDHKWKLIK